MDKKLLKIEIGSHYFKIKTNNSRVYQLLAKFSMKYSLKGFVTEKGRSVFKVIKVFGNRTANENEYRFHIGQLKDFMRELEYSSITDNIYDIIKIPLYTPTKVKLPMNDGWLLRDYQEECKEFIVENDPTDLNTRLVTLPTGTGKYNPLSTPIKIPGGWTTMGRVTMGQEVITQDGSVTNIDGIYPQGPKAVYRVTFADGRSTKCGLEHLWRVQMTIEEKQDVVIDTKEIIRLLGMSHYRSKLYVPLAIHEDAPDLELGIDPYFLGAMLGDGSFISKNYVIKTYKNGSLKEKIRLLSGLMDVGGIVDYTGVLIYSTTSEQMAEDIQYLVRSIGGIAKITSKYSKYVCGSEKSSGKKIYKVQIHMPFGVDIVTDPWMLSKLKNVSQHSESLKLHIVKVEQVGYEECQCISVTHPSHLYVVDDFIVTHNTVTGLSAISVMSHKVLICVLPSYMDKWAKDVTDVLNIKPKDIMLIRGSKELKGLVGAAVEGKLPQKVYIISLRTISNYIKSYEELNGKLKEIGYDANPDELCKILDVGSILIDETHQHLHAVYKLISYSNVPKVVGLSATLLSDDPMVKDMQYVIFPKEKRYDKIKMKKYIKVYAISYRFDDIKSSRIQTTEFKSRNYSHNAFERSILRSKTLKYNYCRLIADIVRIGYDKDYKQGDKCIIFASSVVMCEAIAEHLKNKWPAYDIRRYVEADPYENVIDADIRVTTIQSSGTAIDIPGLRCGILTNSLSSSVSNLQALGRLRELKDRDVKYFYLYSEQIPKQMDYHRKKMELFSDRTKTIKQLACPLRV